MKKVFLLRVLKIPYILLYNYSIFDRQKFNNDYPVLAVLYHSFLQIIGKELNLPVKKCECCGIIYLPDYRTWRHQKYCPYGCIEYNRRHNRKKAKQRYVKKQNSRLLASQYNCVYRQRKINGDICVPQNSAAETEETARKLRAQIKFIYKKMTTVSDSGKLEQLDRILCRLSRRMSNI